MILEVAILNVKPGKEADFEQAFGKTQAIVSTMKDYLLHHFYDSFPTVERYTSVYENAH
ncbi:antibiotic biosynthesis monooxygenase family protein [Marinobacterium arenosum]|uniref:antibiotic biosynthesis monooxygenase family protein n=1 Tax=Marinobacterium arenosum TaxID=2862496 RepID=UPI001C970044|nr:hypothetical protein [Marinobacterium arenosum]MBY4675199.1 hypothetical protein [Marinobacterium arenosum]